MQNRPPQSPADLPPALPVFPLAGVLLLPGGQLPLNVFEPRYLAMVDDALREGRLIGMVQPRGEGKDEDDQGLYPVGCAGRITTFEETGDGRYLITLTGISRFRIRGDAVNTRGYRLADVAWSDFAADLDPAPALDLDRDRLKELLGDYFDHHQLSCDWGAIDDASDQKLITCLAMVCPFDAKEKQALLEAPCARGRAQMFMTMLEFAVRDGGGCSGCH